LLNSAPSGPLIKLVGIVTPPIEVGIEMSAIDISFEG
jgi:hypothetical protein